MTRLKNWRRVSKKDFMYERKRWEHIFDVFVKKKSMNKIFIVVMAINKEEDSFKVVEMEVNNNKIESKTLATFKTYNSAISKANSIMEKPVRR